MSTACAKLSVGFLVVTATLLGGCVGSESARYERQLSDVVPSQSRASDSVSTAFGLDEHGRPRVATSAMRDK